MIGTLLINALYVALTGLLSVLPTASLPSQISSAFTSLVSTAYQFNTVFPVDTLAQILVYFMSFELALYTWKAFRYFLHLVRGN